MDTFLNTTEFLKEATQARASDIFIVAGLPLSYKIHGSMHRTGDRLTPDMTEQIIKDIYELAGNRNMKPFLKKGDDDFSFAIPSCSRFRVSTYKQRGSLAAVIRVIAFELPNPTELGIPETVTCMSERTKGLVLVTGPAGSGKSTTLACLVDAINSTKDDHIITL